MTDIDLFSILENALILNIITSNEGGEPYCIEAPCVEFYGSMYIQTESISTVGYQNITLTYDINCNICLKEAYDNFNQQDHFLVYYNCNGTYMLLKDYNIITIILNYL